MSFSFAVTGSPEDVERALDKVVSYGDASLCNAIRDAVKKMAANAPKDVIFQVEAAGHHDYGAKTSPANQQIGAIDLKVKIFRQPEKAISA